jgi:hypothetical protein
MLRFITASLLCCMLLGCGAHGPSDSLLPQEGEAGVPFKLDSGDYELARFLVQISAREEKRLLGRFQKISLGMTSKQVRRIMGCEPSWRADRSWGYRIPFDPLYVDIPLNGHPALVVEFGAGRVSATRRQKPSASYVARMKKEAADGDTE